MGVSKRGSRRPARDRDALERLIGEEKPEARRSQPGTSRRFEDAWRASDETQRAGMSTLGRTLKVSVGAAVVLWKLSGTS